MSCSNLYFSLPVACPPIHWWIMYFVYDTSIVFAMHELRAAGHCQSIFYCSPPIIRGGQLCSSTAAVGPHTLYSSLLCCSMQALAHLEKHVLDKRTLCPAITRTHMKLLLASVVHDTLKSSHSTHIDTCSNL